LPPSFNAYLKNHVKAVKVSKGYASQNEVEGGIKPASWNARASFLLVCSNLLKDDGTGENNGISRKLR
jgi:hypothetical protein